MYIIYFGVSGAPAAGAEVRGGIALFHSFMFLKPVKMLIFASFSFTFSLRDPPAERLLWGRHIWLLQLEKEVLMKKKEEEEETVTIH